MCIRDRNHHELSPHHNKGKHQRRVDVPHHVEGAALDVYKRQHTLQINAILNFLIQTVSHKLLEVRDCAKCICNSKRRTPVKARGHNMVCRVDVITYTLSSNQRVDYVLQQELQAPFSYTHLPNTVLTTNITNEDTITDSAAPVQPKYGIKK